MAKKNQKNQKKHKKEEEPDIVVEERRCSECGSMDIGTDESELYCKKCGFVFE